MSSQDNTVVFDIGSSSLKVGFAHDSNPKVLSSTVVEDGQTFEPIENGMVKDWERLVSLVKNAVKSLGDFDLDCILVTYPLFCSDEYKNKLMKFFFHFGFKRVHVSLQAPLVLFSKGITSGIIVECGHGITSVVPVLEGFVDPGKAKRLSITGGTISHYLLQLLQMRSNSSSLLGKVAIDKIKEDLCYCAKSIEEDRKLVKETCSLLKTVKLSTGESIQIESERFECVEVYFTPSLCDIDEISLSDAIFDSIQICDIDMRREMYKNIVLYGGSIFPGMRERIEGDVRRRYKSEILRDENSKRGAEVSVEGSKSRKNCVFSGGCVLVELMRDQPNFWVDKEEYFESN